MGQFRSSAFLAVPACLVVESLALDISIIDHDVEHGLIWDRTEAQVWKMYDMRMVKHGKAYNALGEKEKWFEIFKDNLRFIDGQNFVANRAYKVGLNRFADLTNEEYRIR